MRTRRLTALTLAITLFCAIVPAGSAGAASTLTLSAMRFDFKADAGKGGKGEVVVMNDGTEPLTVLMYAADQKVDEEGDLSFITPNRDQLDTLNGPASWLRIEMPAKAKTIGNTPYIELAPGQDLPVRFRFEVPERTAPGDYNSVLFFEMVSLDQTHGTISKLSGRVGARVRVRVKGQIIEGVSLRPFDVDAIVFGDEIPYDFTVSNDGNVDKRVNAGVGLLAPSGEEKAASVAATDSAIYAGSSKDFSGTLKLEGLFVGPFTAEAIVEYAKESGGTQRETLRRTVLVLPAWLLVTIGALAALVLGWMIWRVALRIAKRRLRKEQRRRRERAGHSSPEESHPPERRHDSAAG